MFNPPSNWILCKDPAVPPPLFLGYDDLKDLLDWVKSSTTEVFVILGQPKEPMAVQLSGLSGVLQKLIEANARLWRFEDECRRFAASGVTLAELGECKQKIDSCNRLRVQTINELDRWLMPNRQPSSVREHYASETLGQLLDRLVIATLKQTALRERSVHGGAVELVERQRQYLETVFYHHHDGFWCAELQPPPAGQVKFYRSQLQIDPTL